MSILKRSFTIQTLDENFNDVFRMKRDHYDLLGVMSPVHTLARQSVMRCWELLYDDLSSDTKLPFEDSAVGSTIMHKLSCARTQLYSIENKIQAYAVKHEHESNDSPATNRYKAFMEKFKRTQKENLGPYYPSAPDSVAPDHKNAKPVQSSQTQSTDPLASLRKLKNNTRNLVELFHPGHVVAEDSLYRSWELFWKHLREVPPKNFEELNSATAYLHKLMCTYSQLVNIEIRTVETVLKQNYYKLKRPPTPIPCPQCLNDPRIPYPEPTGRTPKADPSPLPGAKAKVSDDTPKIPPAVAVHPGTSTATLSQPSPSRLAGRLPSLRPLRNSLGREECKESRSANAQRILIREALSAGSAPQSSAQVELCNGLASLAEQDLSSPPLPIIQPINPLYNCTTKNMTS